MLRCELNANAKNSNKFCSKLASFIARFKWKWHECHLVSFCCLLHCGRQLHSRQKNKLHLTKSGGAQKHGEPWTLKSGGGGLKPRSLIEVYAFGCSFGYYGVDMLFPFQVSRNLHVQQFKCCDALHWCDAQGGGRWVFEDCADQHLLRFATVYYHTRRTIELVTSSTLSARSSRTTVFRTDWHSSLNQLGMSGRPIRFLHDTVASQFSEVTNVGVVISSARVVRFLRETVGTQCLRRWLTSELESARQLGARPCSTLYAMTASLYWIHSGTRNQWRLMSASVI